MPTFLFWNIQKKPILHRVARICARHAVDVLMLAECPELATQTVTALNGGESGWFRVSPSRLGLGKIQVYVGKTASRVTHLYDDPCGSLTIRRVRFGRHAPMILAAVHFPSRRDWKPDSQLIFAPEFARELGAVESREGHARTVLVGDFNMNPFDGGMIGCAGTHAMLTRELARRRDGREVQRRPYRTFFNPMWRFLTDRQGKPSGTYYLHSSEPINPFWHVYDQVLVRPELMDKLREVEILDSDGDDQLTHWQGGWPDANVASDHLPILFRLD